MSLSSGFTAWRDASLSQKRRRGAVNQSEPACVSSCWRLVFGSRRSVWGAVDITNGLLTKANRYRAAPRGGGTVELPIFQSHAVIFAWRGDEFVSLRGERQHWLRWQPRLRSGEIEARTVSLLARN